MAGRQSKLRIETLRELHETFTSHPDSEFALLIRTERKVEMDIDAKVIGELQKLLHKAVGHRADGDY